jgi:hypothetical protein
MRHDVLEFRLGCSVPPSGLMDGRPVFVVQSWPSYMRPLGSSESICDTRYQNRFYCVFRSLVKCDLCGVRATWNPLEMKHNPGLPLSKSLPSRNLTISNNKKTQDENLACNDLKSELTSTEYLATIRRSTSEHRMVIAEVEVRGRGDGKYK